MAREQRVDIARIHHGLRTLGYVLFALMLFSVEDDRSEVRAALIGGCLVWPHVAHWVALRSADRQRMERINLFVDCFLGGVIVHGFALRLWPVTAMLAMGMMNALLFGGARLLLAAVGLWLSGVALAWPFLGPMEPHLDTERAGVAVSIAAILSYVVMLGITAYRLRLRQRQMRVALEREERKSHELLVNVFPEAIVPRLRAGESPIADQFADVTVVFADIVEFTPLAERLGPKRTVLLLNDLFRRFDQAAAKFGVEKIETTGDGYLAVAGAPQPLDDHPLAAADFALAVIEAARAMEVPIRVGIHTGPIFGGVIGESRFHYKVFGDTVNTASRVQGQASPGRILVSDAVRKRIEATHVLEERGTIDLKGHGPMRTSWLVSRRTDD